MNWNNAFLIAMALLEYGQALVDVFHTGDIPRAVIMAGAGTSSIAMMYV